LPSAGCDDRDRAAEVLGACRGGRGERGGQREGARKGGSPVGACGVQRSVGTIAALSVAALLVELPHAVCGYAEPPSAIALPLKDIATFVQHANPWRNKACSS
jgi:hypothetical protein